eukprot:gene681-1303_t
MNLYSLILNILNISLSVSLSTFLRSSSKSGLKFSNPLRIRKYYAQPVYNEDGDLDRVGMRRLFLSDQIGQEKLGPGHMRSSPTSSKDFAEQELTKLILALSIFWLTLTTKAKNAFARSGETKASDMATSLVTLPSGIKYQDIVFGDGPSPVIGNRVDLLYSLYYNGVEVENSKNISGTSDKPVSFVFAVNGGDDNGPQPLPVEGLYTGISGMRKGGRRKISIPYNLAFDRVGRPPYVPPYATVLYDVTMC